jgi:hypothetical protein
MKEKVAALTPTYYKMLLDTVADQNEKPNTRMSAWKGLQEFVKGTESGDLVGSEDIKEENTQFLKGHADPLGLFQYINK